MSGPMQPLPDAKKSPTAADGLRTVWRLTAGEHRHFALAGIATVAASTFLYAVPLVPQSIFDLVLGDPASAGGLSRTVVGWLGGDQDVRGQLWRPAIAIASLAALAALCTHLKTRLATGAAERVARRTRDRMYDHVQRLPLGTLARIPSGDLVQRCTSDVETLRLFCANQAPEVARAVLMLLIPLPIMVALDWRLALASLVCIPALLGFTAVYFRRMGPLFAAKEAAEAAMTANVTENLTGIRTVRAFGRAEYENARFATTSAAFRDADATLFRHFARFWSASDLLCFVQQVIVVGLGAWMLAKGSLELGAYFYFLTVVGMFIWPVRMLGRMVVESGKALAAVARLDEILSQREERAADPSPAEAVALARAGRGLAVRFDSVSFAHAGGPRVLDDVSFEIREGETLGIVGPSGAGKTTIVELLLRMHEPAEGRITIDGIDLVRVPRASIRGVVGTVLQQPFLYSRKLRENVLAGAHAVGSGMEEVVASASIAAIHETVLGFPEGYDTVVGEKGITLSGGQRQRIAIARALVGEPRLLILDDALSAVDVHTETDILAALRERRRGQSRLIVAHRLSAVMDADRIVVLDGGKIIQRGTHASLVAEPGLYRTLWEIQHLSASEIDALDQTSDEHDETRRDHVRR